MPENRKTRMARIGMMVVAVLASATATAAAQTPGSSETALGFWERLGDTTLARLTAEALRANHDVQVAQARVRRARAVRAEARLDLFPTVTVAGGYTRQRLSAAQFGVEVPERGLWETELRASWELDLFGRVRKNLRGQSALTESAREEVREMGRLVAAELAAAYYDLRGAQDQLQVARRNAQNQQRTLQLTKDRQDGGRGNAFDTERAQAQVSGTLALIPALESRIAGAQHRIGVLVGREPGALAAELGTVCTDEEPEQLCSLPALPEEVLPAPIDSVIQSRPDVLAAERRLAAEKAFVGAARADYLPRFSVGGTAGFTSTGFDGVGKSGSGRYAVGPMISWPAFNLGRVKAGVDAARALEAEARARHEQTVLLAREELRTALVAYAKARERLTRLAEAAAASDRAAELARIRFRGGVSDFLQVLDAERSLLAAQDELARGRTDAVTALVAVYRAVGAGRAVEG
ncbi:MAG: efflux transporter outer membrane subunit [Gemmatimonadales bacterium]